MSNDPNDFSPLTPGHFLIGDSMISLPQEDTFINSNKRFKLLKDVKIFGNVEARLSN